jgi:hypothetical protein
VDEADAEGARGCHEADPTRDPEYQVWAETEAAYDEAEDQALTVSYDSDARHFEATRDGGLVAFAKWSGDLIKVYLPGGTFIGILYRRTARSSRETSSTPTVRGPGPPRSSASPGSARWPGARAWRTRSWP